MSTFILNNKGNETLSQLIETCKSSSMSVGKELRNAHYHLGTSIATEMIKNTPNRDFAVLVLMRAGLFYAYGIADKIEDLGYSSSLILIHDDTFSEKNISLISGKDVLIVDAVINTGRSIFNLIKQLPTTSIKIATTVIPNQSLSLFDGFDLFTVRTSDNQYTGAKVKHISCGKGPDTGDRLFNTLN